jgi:photosystem II stability/assembly factor-like uncharacterized protein
MRHRVLRSGLGTTLVALSLALAVGPDGDSPPLGPAPERRAENAEYPSDWFLVQRAWPQRDVKPASRRAAWRHAEAMHAVAAPFGRAAGAAWMFAGPTNIGGRIADVACHPGDPSTCWVGAAEGGVMKTTDGGATWIPTMDSESSLSIGDIAVDPSDPSVLYVGTGEPNGGGGSVTYGGTGIFKSTDGGASWANVGLPDSRFIGRVVVDPQSSSRVFVAVLGALFSTSPERGVYRSTDAGASWAQVLALNDSTGAVDVVCHPTDPGIVYAALWQRLRTPGNLSYGGDGSGLWRSTDGGDTWNELTNGLPSGPSVGRIGLAIAESDPDVLYAIYAEADPGAFAGLYRTTDGGDTWTRTNDSALSNVFATFGWWFGNVRVDPTDPDVVFAVGYEVWRSLNGGASWANIGSSMHVDHHALDFAPNGDLYEGNDGGMYKSVNGGVSWAKLPDLPATQFYAIDVDEQNPQRLYGGAQDNGTNRTLTGNLDDWANILGGDGFTCLVDPVNNAYVYAEWQNGNLYRSTNGGASFQWAQSGLSGRRNWSMPVVLDPGNPATLYAGTDRVFRSVSRAATWSVVSPDLTNGPGPGNRTFGTITTLAVAPTDGNVVWAGTDDANVWVTTNGGGTWTHVSSGLPQRWITRVAVDPADATVAYVTVSGFRWDEPQPHVFRSTDFGATWTDVSGNLPEAPVNDIVVDPDDSSVLWVATDFGVYGSTDTGTTWSVLGTGLPNVVVSDLRLHQPTRTLVAGTYGRSMWKLDLGSVVAAEPLAQTGVVLHAPAPNPVASGNVALHVTLSAPTRIRLRIYDVTGRLVADVADGVRGAGDHGFVWDGRDTGGARAAGGVYFARLDAGACTQTRKITRLAR